MGRTSKPALKRLSTEFPLTYGDMEKSSLKALGFFRNRKTQSEQESPDERHDCRDQLERCPKIEVDKNKDYKDDREVSIS